MDKIVTLVSIENTSSYLLTSILNEQTSSYYNHKSLMISIKQLEINELASQAALSELSEEELKLVQGGILDSITGLGGENNQQAILNFNYNYNYNYNNYYDNE